MPLGAIKVAFCLIIAAIVVETDYINGIACYVIGAVLVVGAIALFDAGCRVAAQNAKQQALNNHEGTLDIILAESGVRPYRPTPYQE